MNKVIIHLAAQWRAVYPFAGSLSQTEEYRIRGLLVIFTFSVHDMVCDVKGSENTVLNLSET